MRDRQVEAVEVTKTETRVVRDIITCDMCGRAADPPDAYWDDSDGCYWADFPRHAASTAVYRLAGDTLAAFHICPACWDKVAEFIGVEPTVTEWAE